MSNGLVVSKVIKGSIAAEMEIEPGDIIMKVGDYDVTDIIDLQYYTSSDEFIMFIKKENSEIWELEIEKEPGELIGIEVCSVSVDGLKKCSNNCVFCFVRQMPPGMRDSLYDRDDDYRLSVTQGSYITLSNLKSEDFQRIIDMHINPLYISVHAWRPEVRRKLMKNLKAGDLPEQIKHLTDAGIMLHTQVVLVPGYNDNEVLEETVENLASLYPSVQSIGIVPVGLTKFRNDLPDIRTVTKIEAQKILDRGSLWQQRYKSRTEKNLVYFSDEFYVLAGKDFPKPAEYDDFPQLENGIGMASLFKDEVYEYISFLPKDILPKRIHLVTGVSAVELFRNIVGELSFIKGLTLTIHEIVNDYFGATVTVAGLLTAQDIARQLGDLKGEDFLIPSVMLKADEDIFLDGYSISWLEEQVNGRAVIIKNNGISFLEGIIGRRLVGGNE